MNTKNNNQSSAIALFSGGLDSIMACRVIARQGIKVHAVKFVSPFFDYGLLAREDEFRKEVKEKYGIDVFLRDISLEYIELLKDPPHGYGKHFNPCVDCKIFMVSRAKEIMEELNASFLITGEVIGQRPMSQRRDTLRIIERDSGCSAVNDRAKMVGEGGVLLRPLCARNLKKTKPEIDRVVDRERLYGFSGRGRTAQIELARQHGITDFPAPAGGCILTDPNISKRIKAHYQKNKKVTVSDMRFIQIGRQFRLPRGGWLVMGRREAENEIVSKMLNPGDIHLKLVDRPGPSAVLRYSTDRSDLKLAAGLVARYGKKGEKGVAEAGAVSCISETEEVITGTPPNGDSVRKMMW